MLTFSIKDAIDILLVSLLLYYIYRLMKESRSGNIFIGIIVFIIVWIFVSRVFNMSLLGSLMDKAVNLGTIALVILFQEEIRAFFSSIGTHRSAGKLLHLFNHNEHKKTSRKDIMPIVMACMSMSKQRVGALIVFERYIGLGDIINSGEVINANISQRLIENIFFKNSPLHDGAMIIRDGKIAAAGCVLPLSNNLDLGKDMGTRHRACLGIAENSDAIAIVVSEETGIISMAKNGVLIRHFDRQSLYTRLIDEMIPKESTVEKNTADSWVEQAKKLWNWISQKGEDEQQ